MTLQKKTKMITSTQLYWITRLVGINTLLCIVAFVSVIVCSAIVTMLCMGDIKWEDKITKKVRNAAIPCLLFSVLGLTFIPTTKEMAAILVIPQIANSEKFQEAGGKLYDLAVEWMDALRPHKTKGEK